MNQAEPSSDAAGEPASIDRGWAPTGICRAAKLRWEACSERFRRTTVFLVVTGALASWLLPIAVNRLVDGDEGYLLIAARLVSEGRWPYRDFFLPQAPLVPALFGLLFWTLGRGWVQARLLAGLMAVAMGLLVYRETLCATRRRSAALFAAALFAMSDGTIGWLTIVKGFGVSALLMLMSATLMGTAVRQPAIEPSTSRPSRAALASGLAAGLAVCTRLYTVVLVPALALYLVRELGINRATMRRAGWYALGCLVGLLPLLVCYARAPRTFLFDTLLYHGVREYGQDSLFGTFREKLPLVLKTMGLDSDATYGERQWMAAAILASLAPWLRYRLRSTTTSPAGWVWPVLLGASVLPNPFQPQYLCLALPFFAIESGRLLHSLLDGRFSQKLRRWPVAVAAAVVIYLGYHACVARYERDRYLEDGAAVPGIWATDRAKRWQIATLEAVARAVDAQGIPVGASWWPGYFVNTRASIAVELANDFGFRAANALSAEERRRIHVVSHADVGEMIRRRQPRLFVQGNWATYPWASWLPENGYQVRQTVENVRVWTTE
jgi:hypothetical protein